MVSLIIPPPPEPTRSWFDLYRVCRARLENLILDSTFGAALASYFLRGEPAWVTDLASAPAWPAEDLSPTATAARGFLLAIDRDRYASLGTAFRAGVRICAAQKVPRRGPSVHWNPQLLVGVAAGLGRKDGADDERLWLKDRLGAIRAEGGGAGRLLAIHGLSCMSGSPVDADAFRGQAGQDAESAAIALWVARRYGRDIPDEAANEVDRLLREWEHRVLTSDPSRFGLPAIAAAVQVSSAALRETGPPRMAGVARIADLIRRFPTAIAREPQPPKNEYELQRILWTMIAGTYPDLQDETWLSKFGVYHPRADFAIESLKLVVEAKYTRAAGDFRKIQDELTSDASSYASRPAVIDRIIGVVYDRSSSQYQYENFRQALLKVAGIAEVIVFPGVSPRPTKRA